MEKPFPYFDPVFYIPKFFEQTTKLIISLSHFQPVG